MGVLQAGVLLSALCLFFLACQSQVVNDDYENWPYFLGPYEFKDYPEFTFTPNPVLRGKIWLRVNQAVNKVQFQYYLNPGYSMTPYWPFFAMHLHKGEPKAGNKGGPIVVTIAGKGDLYGDALVNGTDAIICNSQCLPGAIGCLPNCPPDKVIKNYVFAYAYSCDGGCNGDERDGDGGKALVPSRKCDIDTDNPSNPLQNVWLTGKYSDERSGNVEDGEEYSPYSIFKKGNFDKWCSETIDFLPTLFEPGNPTYVALHTNYNATGVFDLLTGTILAVINDGSGIELKKAQDPNKPVCECPKPTKCPKVKDPKSSSSDKSPAASVAGTGNLAFLFCVVFVMVFMLL